jgi:hypothetical protein
MTRQLHSPSPHVHQLVKDHSTTYSSTRGDGECSWRVIYYMVLMSMLLSGPLLVGEHVVIESVAGESFITWC